MKERLQKLLAQANLGSRRATETIIEQGRVRVNGKIAKLGDSADPDKDVVEVDGKRLRLSDDTKIYIALNKPKNVVSTNIGHRGDERTTIRELIPLEGHLFTIGRLDADSEGLVVLTNDGDLANKLSHPRYQHTKTYRVIVQGLPTADSVEHWQNGMFLSEEEGTTGAAFVTIAKGGKDYSTLKVVMTEGKKRQIRRIAQNLGHPVKRLVRTHIGMLELGNLEEGEWRELNAHDVKLLSTHAPELKLIRERKRKLAGYPPRGARASTEGRPRRDTERPARDGERKPARTGRPSSEGRRSDSSSGETRKPARSSRPSSEGRRGDSGEAARPESRSSRSARSADFSETSAETDRRPARPTRRPPTARGGEASASGSGETRKPARSSRPSSEGRRSDSGDAARPESRSSRPARSSDFGETSAETDRRPSRPTRRPPAARGSDAADSGSGEARKPTRPRRSLTRTNDTAETTSGETRKPARPRRPANPAARSSDERPTERRRSPNSTQKPTRSPSRPPRKRGGKPER